MNASKHKIFAGAVVVATVACSVLASATAASATELAPPKTCWVDVSTKDSLCVDTGTDLIAAVVREKGIQLVVPDGTPIGGVPAKASAATGLTRSIQASTVTGILYDDVNYGGGSFVASSSGTCPAASYGYASLSAYGWNDRASSFRSYAGCTSAVFANDNYGGASYGYYANASSLGSLNDQASSWRMH